MTTEEKLKEMLGDYYEMGVPGSPNAAILQNMLGADNELRDPQSENEALLKLIYEDVIGAVYDARDEAQTAAAQAGTAAEAVANKAPAIVDTASGSIASFPDGADGVEIKSATVQIVPKQAGSGDPSPDNVRAITGWDAVTVYGTGVNLFDKSTAVHGQLNASGERVELSNDNYLSDYISVKPNTSYYALNVAPLTQARPIAEYDINKTFIKITSLSTAASTQGVFTTTANTHYIRVGMYGDTRNTTAINYPATDTSYHVYDATAYPLTLPSAVYGGQAVYNGGGLRTVTSDRGIVTLDGTQNIYRNGTTATFTEWVYAPTPAKKPAPSAAQQNYKLASDKLASTAYTDAPYQLTGRPTNANVVFTLGPDLDVTAAKAWLAANPTTIVYELATPTTYTVTTEQLLTLYGQNNIWADCGDISVEYRADTKIYINKILGSSETDMVADTNIESGKYFFVGGQLYLSTAAIAAGSTIIPGTNCTATNVAEALNIINA